MTANVIQRNGFNPHEISDFRTQDGRDLSFLNEKELSDGVRSAFQQDKEKIIEEVSRPLLESGEFSLEELLSFLEEASNYELNSDLSSVLKDVQSANAVLKKKLNKETCSAHNNTAFYSVLISMLQASAPLFFGQLLNRCGWGGEAANEAVKTLVAGAAGATLELVRQIPLRLEAQRQFEDSSSGVINADKGNNDSARGSRMQTLRNLSLVF